MTNNTILAPSEISTETAAEFAHIADDMLLSAVQSQKVQTVQAGLARKATSRAWSFGGNVD